MLCGCVRKKNRDARLEKSERPAGGAGRRAGEAVARVRRGQELFVELGCGKGRVYHGAVRAISGRVAAGRRESDGRGDDGDGKADRAGCANVRFLIADGAAIDMLLPAHSVARLYLNFSDPWPKKRNAKEADQPPFSGTL